VTYKSFVVGLWVLNGILGSAWTFSGSVFSDFVTLAGDGAREGAISRGMMAGGTVWIAASLIAFGQAVSLESLSTCPHCSNPVKPFIGFWDGKLRLIKLKDDQA
jgi:hypothetical protein